MARKIQTKKDKNNNGMRVIDGQRTDRSLIKTVKSVEEFVDEVAKVFDSVKKDSEIDITFNIRDADMKETESESKPKTKSKKESKYNYSSRE